MEDAIRAVERAYDDAWRAGDIDGLLACLATDAVLINPHGQIARGHAEIRRELTRVLRAFGSGSKHTSVISRVDFVTGDVAVVDGEAFLQDAQSGGATGSLHHRFTDVLVKRKHEWFIAHIRAYAVADRPDRENVGAG